MLDSSTVTAIAAIGGSVVGGLASFVTTYFSQRHQTRRERLFRELERREVLYGQFIEKAAALFLDSVDKDLEDPAGLVDLVAVIARIRLTGSMEIVHVCEQVMRDIIASYHRPPLARREIFEQTREELGDPLAAFTTACRMERQSMIADL